MDPQQGIGLLLEVGVLYGEELCIEHGQGVQSVKLFGQQHVLVLQLLPGLILQFPFSESETGEL